MKFRLRDPLFMLGLVLAWRIGLLIFTAQPIPANDAFGYDGAVVNYLHGGGYYNPSFSLIFPISGRQVYAGYPPVYQGVLFIWMKLCGTSALSAMGFHLVLFAISGFLTVAIVKRYFPPAAGWGLAALLFFGFTFDDRPDALAFVFGVGALGLVLRQMSSDRFRAGIALALTATLLLGLYTSVIAGAYFFGVGVLTCVAGGLRRGKLYWLGPFILAAGLFVAITGCIIRWEPLWWDGFMESARQQSVSTGGFHVPSAPSIVKLVRTMPVFVIALVLAPFVLARPKEIISPETPWVALVSGIFVMTWILLVASVTVLAPDYANYAIPSQVILAAGLLALGERRVPARASLLRGLLVGCVLLVSVRAVGMSTWGAVCAWKNSYESTQQVLGTELGPFVISNRPVVVSSAFLYRAAGMGVKDPIHSDWYFDHSHWTSNAQFNALTRLRPTELLLTQFDYYRSFVPVLNQLQGRPELVRVKVRNLAASPVPEEIPALQRVVQHISWAPVLVELDWKEAAPP